MSARRECVIHSRASRPGEGLPGRTFTARAGARGRGRVVARAHGAGNLGEDEAYANLAARLRREGWTILPAPEGRA